MQPTVPVQQNSFEKTPTEASFTHFSSKLVNCTLCLELQLKDSFLNEQEDSRDTYPYHMKV